ncbi:transposase [Chryseobacterium sp. CBSDS_008]|uniref:transposase n=1 Tax=Chryseobacterium sp. CBSDS_008 TaxID=3415265 RepID=UPI003CEA02DF
MIDFKNIHIGSIINQRVIESKIEMPRICSFFKCSEHEILEMYTLENLNSELLLKWSKLLDYDLFRIYTQHLILFSPPTSMHYNVIPIKKQQTTPEFRKNIYTKELIKFILELIESGERTKQEIINDYNIPKSTLYKWINKYASIG